MNISVATADAQIARCFPVMKQLRTHLSEAEFVERVLRQRESGYELAYLEAGENVSCVAGFRISECLAWGRFMYVDDLVTDEAIRSKGHGQIMFQWLINRARAANCKELHLDSGVQRFGAHRFYLMQGMDITCHHFGIKL